MWSNDYFRFKIHYPRRGLTGADLELTHGTRNVANKKLVKDFPRVLVGNQSTSWPYLAKRKLNKKITVIHQPRTHMNPNPHQVRDVTKNDADPCKMFRWLKDDHLLWPYSQPRLQGWFPQQEPGPPDDISGTPDTGKEYNKIKINVCHISCENIWSSYKMPDKQAKNKTMFKIWHFPSWDI